MASKGSAGDCKGTLKYSAKRLRSFVMYANLLGTKPGGLLPVKKEKCESKQSQCAPGFDRAACPAAGLQVPDWSLLTRSVHDATQKRRAQFEVNVPNVSVAAHDLQTHEIFAHLLNKLIWCCGENQDGTNLETKPRIRRNYIVEQLHNFSGGHPGVSSRSLSC